MSLNLQPALTLAPRGAVPLVQALANRSNPLLVLRDSGTLCRRPCQLPLSSCLLFCKQSFFPNKIKLI